MKYIEDDLISLGKEGYFEVIVHGCNCFHKMGEGIAKQIKKEFPEAYEIDLKTAYGSRGKMGRYSYADCDGLIVVNAYTQFHWGRGKVQVDYDAIGQVFGRISEEFEGHKIGIPKIGAGLAGGDWNKIEKIIDQYDMDITTVIYKEG